MNILVTEATTTKIKQKTLINFSKKLSEALRTNILD